MFRYLLAFYSWFLAPQWMQNRTPDYDHFYRRFFTAKHKAKRSIAKLIWIAALLLLLFFPYPPLIVSLLLFTTFISFSLLDESK
ncbi:MAG: hypothetical protein CMI05_04940 [Oceanospirillaceae bacterium]|nr:hypothetical protein [Oceanospirillaceae bacterium]